MQLTQELYTVFDLAGTIAFAISGALVAIKKEMDLSGALTLAFVTGNGGGTVRDLILHCPVFWTIHIFYILISIGAGALTFLFYYFFSALIESRLFNRLLELVDALGLVAFTIGGVSKTLTFHQSGIIAIMMGTLTAIGGGMIRDVLAQRIPMVFRMQLYATPTVIGGTLYVLLISYNAEAAIIASAVGVLFFRLMGMLFNWHLPTIPLKT